MKRYHVAFIVVFLVILSLLFAATLDYPKRARNFPLIVMGFAILILMKELAGEILPRRRLPSLVDKATPAKAVPRETVVEFFKIIGWIAGLGVLIWLSGFLVAFPLFIFVYIKIKGEHWLWAAAVSFSFWLIVYVGFGILLKLPLYKGLFFD
jgi:hypothetical protein